MFREKDVKTVQDVKSAEASRRRDGDRGSGGTKSPGMRML